MLDGRGRTTLFPARKEFALAILLAVIAGIVCYEGSRKVDSALYHRVEARDVWMDGDLDRFFAIESDRMADGKRNQVHPLYSLLTYPANVLLEKGLGKTTEKTVRTFHAIVAGLWVFGFYFLLRLIRCRVRDAFVFTAVAGVSASSIMWFVVPETYSLGSVSLIPALILAALPLNRASVFLFLAASAISLSVTVTNWMVGLLATFVKWPLRKAIFLSVGVFVIVGALAMAQKSYFPKSQSFVGYSPASEKRFIVTNHSGGPFNVLRSFFFHTMVMPKTSVVESQRKNGWDNLSVQRSGIASAGTWGLVAVAAWTCLLVIGVYGLVTIEGLIHFRMVVTFALIGQMLLHLVYGSEAFLYSLHFLPLLVSIAALGSLTRFRRPVLILAVVFTVSALANNVRQFNGVCDYVRTYSKMKTGT